MKTLLALSVTLAAVTLALKAAPAPAVAYVETNLTFALKMYINNEDEEQIGKFDVQNYATVTIKNADIIRAYGEQFGFSFDKSARIIKVEAFDVDGLTTGDVQYYIRDKTQPNDVNITSTMTLTREGYPDVVQKIKYLADAPYTGTKTSIEKTKLRYFVNDPEINNTDEEVNLYSIDRASYRRVLFNGSLVELETRSAKAHGDAELFVDIKGETGYIPGIVEGTFKISGPKAIPAL